ncbi:MAG: imidazoleglycerol-phosphate dehydratase HisB [Christensenellales bacterium]|jgi:imidazoleglycerol-phosphate dehydratase
MVRTADIKRKTRETDISVSLNIDGTGECQVKTGIGFFDHMLELFAKHGKLDLKLSCDGDIDVDGHHSVEDAGICIGKAMATALGDKRGITRYASERVPMDEALAEASLDISGRPYLVFDADLSGMVGAFDAQLAEEFFRALAINAGLTLHLRVIYGKNTHHILEAMFKAAARAFRQAAAIDPLETGIPSTKGIL